MTSDAEKVRVAETFDAAADHFDAPGNRFLAQFGQQLVRLVAPRPGERVLDCATGTGHYALAAAAAVGPTGNVIGIDLSSSLLDLARTKATHAGLTNLELHQGDMEEALDRFGPASFDVITCGLAVFYVEDMASLVRSFWAMLRPGGRLGLTIWGMPHFEPAQSGIWTPALAAVRPDLVDHHEPWHRLSSEAGLRSLTREAGIDDASVQVCDAPIQFLLGRPEEWWDMALGMGNRWHLDEVGPDIANKLREQNVAWIRDHAVRSIEIGVLYAIAHK